MRVGGPRVGPLGAGGQVAAAVGLARAHSPNAPSTCSPRAGRVRDVGDRADRVHRPGVDLAELGADDGRAVVAGQRARPARRGACRTCVVDATELERRACRDRAAAGPGDGHVGQRAGEHPHGRRAGQPVALDVPARVGQHVGGGPRRGR